MRRLAAVAIFAALGIVLGATPVLAGGPTDVAATPEQLVAAYDSLADTILAAKKTEWNLVHGILATTYGHAEATVAAAKRQAGAGKSAKAEIETLAALVTQLGNEGDAAVAGTRKRLVEAGHHHNAQGEQQGIYDKGFVIVTRAARKALLDSAKRIAKLGAKPSVAAIDAEWKLVQDAFKTLHADVPGMS